MRNPIKILAVIAIVACFAFSLPAKESKKISVVIDAGHGGKDEGSVFNNLSEKDIVTQISSQIKALNTNADVELHFIRETDEFVSLEERVEAINKHNPDLVLSLHLNYSKDADIYGMEFFVTNAEQSEKSLAYAEKLADRFKNKEYNTERGVKQASFFILKNANVPAVMFQIGFLSNETDRLYLTSENGQNDVAKTILEFIEEIK